MDILCPDKFDRAEVVLTEKMDDFGMVKKRVVLDRDETTCALCGFRSATAPTLSTKIQPRAAGGRGGGRDEAKGPKDFGFITIHPKTHNHQDTRITDLISICEVCHITVHPAEAAARGGLLVWLPGITQANLNILNNLLAVAQSRGGAFGKHASTLRAKFEDQSGQAEKLLQTTDPEVFSSAAKHLLRQDKRIDKVIHRGIGAVKTLLPVSAFQDAANHWDEYCWENGGSWENHWRSYFQQWQAMNGEMRV